MACRRSISTTRILLARRLSYAPIYHHSHRDRGDDAATVRSSPTPPPSRSPAYATDFSQRRSSYVTVTRTGPLQFSRDRRCLLLSAPSSPGVGIGMWLAPSLSSRSLSTAVGGESSVSDDVFLPDVVTADLASHAAPAVVTEVAAAAADSAYPVAALQHLIDGMHSFTGLNWWASIALTTILIRGATVPLLINQLKSTSKLSIMRPRLEELNQKFKESAMEPDAVAKHNQRVMAVFKEFGVTPLAPLKGLFIQGPIFVSFFLAIRNMAEKVPSFQTGGALWFTDLTTPDSFYILPILTSLTFWITVECNMQEGMEGNPIAGTMKNFSRILAVVAVPLMMSFPKAIFCYWLTSNIFSLAYGLVIKQPAIKKKLNIPEVPVPVPASPVVHRDLSPFSVYRGGTEASEMKPPACAESSKIVRRISAASVLNQRIRFLEKKIKARNDKRKS